MAFSNWANDIKKIICRYGDQLVTLARQHFHAFLSGFFGVKRLKINLRFHNKSREFY